MVQRGIGAIIRVVHCGCVAAASTSVIIVNSLHYQPADLQMRKRPLVTATAVG